MWEGNSPLLLVTVTQIYGCLRPIYCPEMLGQCRVEEKVQTICTLADKDLNFGSAALDFE